MNFNRNASSSHSRNPISSQSLEDRIRQPLVSSRDDPDVYESGSSNDITPNPDGLGFQPDLSLSEYGMCTDTNHSLEQTILDYLEASDTDDEGGEERGVRWRNA
jgi:hypothetical protein